MIEKVTLNLPGTNTYDPSMPWVYKVGWDSKIAVDLYFYIDDGRPTAGTAKDSWRVTQRVCQLLGYLVIQDACRKRTAPSQEHREWAGTSVESPKGLATMFVSHKKWLRSKEVILWFIQELGEDGMLDFKELERDRGYLVYISRTYRAMVPYLKCIHQMLDSWKSGRNKDGWKLSPEDLREFYSH